MNSPSPSPFLSPSLSPYPPPFPLLHHHHLTLSQIIILDTAIATSSLVLLSLLLLLLFLFYKKSNNMYNRHRLSALDDDNHVSVVAILHANSHPLTDIYTATDNFHPSLILGRGPLGTVYLASSTHPFAVKRIHSHLVLGNVSGLLDFSSKLKSLSFANHPNVVPILGYSEAPGERIIISELVGTKSLDFYLHHERLEWKARLRIAAGAARGIEHLHEGSAPGVVHGRVKPSNILLDDDDDGSNLCARVCDYGLSFLDLGNYERVMVGYLDGEGGEETSKANDVYGFGVVLLEILSGRKSEGGLVLDWALPLIRMGRVEELLDRRVGFPEEEGMVLALVRAAKVASACVGNGRKSRPSIGQVAAILSNLEREVCFESNHGRRRRISR